jgi:hypothetical protein
VRFQVQQLRFDLLTKRSRIATRSGNDAVTGLMNFSELSTVE